MKTASRWASCESSPIVRPRLRETSPLSGSSRPAMRRRSVVLPAPFGPTRPTRSPSAIAATISSRITNVPTSRVTAFSRTIDISGFQPPPGRRVAPAGPRRAAARRVAAACLVRSVRSDQRGPVRRTPPVIPRRIALAPARSPAGSRWHHEQKWVLRAPMTMRLTGRPQRGHGSPVRW